MGDVITRSSAKEAILADFNTANKNAAARGGDVAQCGTERLGPLVTPIQDNRAQLEAARVLVENLSRGFLVLDDTSDREIAAVADEQWNAVGRSKQSTEYSMIWGSGIGEWRNGDPTKQPNKMRILVGRIRATTHPALQARKEEWASRIEVCGAAQAEACPPLEAADATAASLSSLQRTLANHAQVALSRFKRDLKNLGMTETQIHEIIPDRPRAKKAGPETPTDPAA
jgi:hypothetical protein